MKDRQIGIIGGSGFVGHETVKYLRSQNTLVLDPSSSEVDITNSDEVNKFIGKFQGKSILLLAADTNVEGTEKDPARALKVNVRGVKNCAEAADKYNKHLIFISSDFVFEGTLDNLGPYQENAQIADVNSRKIGEYARTKVMGEKILEETDGKVAIIRIAYPFGSENSPKDFLHKTLLYIQKGYLLFDDQQFTPTHIPDFVRAIELIINHELTGIFHVATHPVTTPYEFGKYAAQKLSTTQEIKKGSLIDFLESGTKTPKPIYGGLDTTKTQEVLGLKFHSWQEAIDEMI